MLAELRIKNLGLVEEMTLPFGNGLNVLTGETGAGKSIIISALDLALGGRASAEAIRTGEEKASVSACFTGLAEVAGRLREAGVEMEDDLLLQREVSRNGRNVCRLNGQMVPLALYREAGRVLVDMHGQHEQHHLTLAEKRLDLCDRFGGTALFDQVARLGRAFVDWQEAAAVVARLAAEEADTQRRKAELEHFLSDVDKLAPQPGEEQELERERLYLGNREKIASLLFGSCEVLYGDGDHGQALIDLVGRLVNDLGTLAVLDERAVPLGEAMREALCLIEETALELASLRDHLEFEPARLAMIEERLDLYARLRRRYGHDGDALVARAEEARGEIACIGERLTGRDQAVRREHSLKEEYEAIAAVVGGMRREAGLRLEGEVTGRLRTLEMEKVVFKAEFAPAAAGPRGLDAVDFLISPNPGEPLKPLNRIASGGELSRVMLALKAVVADALETPTLVFDEVDAGTGGVALSAVADCLSALGLVRQVVVVTHAARVASRAGNHIRVFKEEQAGRTHTGAQVLDEDERLDELTRMLGGRDGGKAARGHAQAMMEAARRTG
ncbi:MAG: DNA repair protein RecN [Peptococcaceae bacterium]|jgi:DNA repair protein RecN (Recombination protein N)|nr:DNA repair protein RecN [Peptococcaceae bacterium]